MTEVKDYFGNIAEVGDTIIRTKQSAKFVESKLLHITKGGSFVFEPDDYEWFTVKPQHHNKITSVKLKLKWGTPIMEGRWMEFTEEERPYLYKKYWQPWENNFIIKNKI